jgi:hypothetical protein
MFSKPSWKVLAGLCSLLGCSAEADKGGPDRAVVPDAAGRPATTAGAGAKSGGGGGGSGGDFGNPQNPSAPAAPTGGKPGMGMMGECAAVTQTAENRLQPADIIIGIDTSGSMDEEAGFVQENMNAFSQQIIASGIDVRVILVAAEQPAPTMMGGGLFGGGDNDDFGICIGAPLGSGMCPADSKPPVYTHINSEVGSNDVLSVLISAYPSYKAQLRADSLKTFVSVTDDDANEPPINSAAGFISAVQGLEPMDPMFWSNWHYSSIYCFTDCEQAAEIGAVHADLVMQTQGVGGDLCLQSFKPVFDALAKQVLEGVKLECDWDIPDPTANQTFDAMKTNVQIKLDGAVMPLGKAATAGDCGDRDGWHYDDEAAPTRVVACPASCTRIQAANAASVDILFGCATTPLM